MGWYEAGREHYRLKDSFVCAPRPSRGTSASPYKKGPSSEPWADVVQSQLRKAKLPVKAPMSYQVLIEDDQECIKAIFVWRYDISEDNPGEATIFFEFLATHYELRKQGLATRAYDEFESKVDEFIDDHPSINRLFLAAVVDHRNVVMQHFLGHRGWVLTQAPVSDQDLLAYGRLIEFSEGDD